MLLLFSFARLLRGEGRVLDMDQAPLAVGLAINLGFRSVEGKWHSIFALLGGEIPRELRPREIAVGVNRNRIKCQLPPRIGVA